MQYLIHDLLKLPLEDRLVILEKILCSLLPTDNTEQFNATIERALRISNNQLPKTNF